MLLNLKELQHCETSRTRDCIVIVFFLANQYTKQNMTFKNKFIYFGLVCLFVVAGVGATYLSQNKDSQFSEAEDNLLSKLKPAPEGYAWYATKEGGFAFLHPSISRVDICSDPALCTVLGVSTGGIIINNNPYKYKTIPGGKDGAWLWKRTGNDVEKVDMYPKGLSITYMDTESRMTFEKADAFIREYNTSENGVGPIIFTEQNRGTYEADYMKPLPPVFLITRSGVFKISTLANDPLQKDGHNPEMCATKFNEDYCTEPTRNYEDYAELPKYINTIIQSFTIIE